jgi:prepilin-type N-terminal cleavage/methylation domain-containing protein
MMIKNNKAFTLLELMIVITIVGIMMIWVYAPYNYFQKKTELKIAAKSISKTISESRNKAIFWISSGSTNQSVGVYFEKNSNIIRIYNYPYNFWTWSKIEVNDKYLKEKINIWKNIFINKIENKDNALFLFEAISWKFYPFYFESWNKNNLTDLWSDNIYNIDFSYKQASSWPLQKTVKYYTKTFITDY